MDSIPFPFEPYDEQKKLMAHIYDALDKGGISILESPTGTGKSMSIICSSLHWLLNYNKHNEKKSNHNDNNSKKEATPEWVNEFFEKQQKQEKEKKLEEKRELLRKQQETLFHSKEPLNKRQKLNHSNKNDDPFLIQDNDPNNRLTANDWLV